MTGPDPLDAVPVRLLSNEQAAMLLRKTALLDDCDLHGPDAPGHSERLRLIHDLTARLAESGIAPEDQP